MKNKSALLLCTLLAAVAFVGVLKMQKQLPGATQKEEVPDAAPSKIFALAAAELKDLQLIAVGGDCEAAYKVARHYSFGTNQLDKSVQWLRIAAKCDDVGAKGELILMLLATEDDATNSKEVASLLSEIRKLDVTKAEEYEDLVSSQRSDKTGGGVSPGNPTRTGR